MTKLYHTRSAIILERDGSLYRLPDASWDVLINRPNLKTYLESQAIDRARIDTLGELLPPIGSQEVWAAGVTYFRSLNARVEEIRQAGSGSENFYDKVYSAQRPELFFKASAHRVVGTGANVRIRRDAKWTVPEPE